ncbi:MAG: phospholipase D-like domain-containing protein [Candidatus Bathyarchaeota archaeon]|nr:phospholipase D-like domain-containing protein [Candidatus Bathyarchaeota archaeon]
MDNPKYWDTVKGEIIKFIVMNGGALWEELQDHLKIDRIELNKILSELYQSDDIYKNDSGSYRVNKELYKLYKQMIENTNKEPDNDILKKIENWDYYKKIDLKTEKGFAYINDRYLSSFVEFIIENASKDIFSVNPIIENCAFTKQLGEVSGSGRKVVLITNKPEKNASYYKNSEFSTTTKKELHQGLVKNGALLYYNDNVHSKIIVVDGVVAVVSSLNYTSNAQSSKTWEAGVAVFDKIEIEKIINSMKEQLKQTDRVTSLRTYVK